MSGLASQRLDDLLAEVAAPRPAPGGGSSAAVATALAAALVEMAARIELGREGAPERLREIADRAGALRSRALELAERELSSYAPVLEVRRLPVDEPERDARLRSALAEASESPLEIAEAAAEAASLGAEVARASNPSVRGDALAGTVLAEAAAAAAATLVEINLEGRTHPALERARAARRQAHEVSGGLGLRRGVAGS